MHPRRRRYPPAGRRARRRTASRRPLLPFRWFARACVGLLVPLLGVTWIVASHTVTLQVDGEPQPVLTYAQTVDELLERMGVAYSAYDELHPPADTQLRDGMVIELVHAREITVSIGGEEDTVLVTALSVDEVIDQLRNREDVTRRSVVRTSRLMPVRTGMTVEVRNPVPVTVVADGKEREVVTDASTVAGVLSRLDIELGNPDRVTPKPLARVRAGLRIVVVRVAVRARTREVIIEHQTEERPTSRLPQGERREIQAGSDGIERVRERVRFVDGAEVSRKVVDRTTVRAARTRIVEVGTAQPEQQTEQAPPPPARQHSDSDNSTSDATASDGRSATGEASYYHHPEEGLTAAHRTLPFGTVVTVTNRANGKSVQVTINDRGPYIDGRIIDLNTSAFDRIAARSTGVINVRITW